ncbi:excinuclease ABC subunit C [Sinomonas atrocyanea]|uniref:Excinuclease ABC subunit C n=1 Tax=Sinomonas atrocyanea TaxID=37927 RepID=A0A126ZWT2_9MICC|nr:hypothetical protein [Sinomonas atrocyanea]AMM31630.1 excinuclease ABC subunit C [Sinomonas atrocyanea]GEB64219.1 hypothetical protein SAT01_16670 [Sinomonas atrocyanea]GGG57350.1 hypothetical protein GCM10007172_05270 [Sinomonas atrocyanea]
MNHPSLLGTPTTASLTLREVLTRMGSKHSPRIDLDDVHVLRHVYRPGGHEEMQKPEDLTDPEKLLAYTSSQHFSALKFTATPPTYWVIFIADGGRRARLFGTFENRGELPVQPGATRRFFDLRPSSFLAPLAGTLVIDWDNPRSWQRRADRVADRPVLEFRA